VRPVARQRGLPGGPGWHASAGVHRHKVGIRITGNWRSPGRSRRPARPTADAPVPGYLVSPNLVFPAWIRTLRHLNQTTYNGRTDAGGGQLQKQNRGALGL